MTHAGGCSRPRPTSKPVSPGWFRLTCPECGHVGSEAASNTAGTRPGIEAHHQHGVPLPRPP
jgi:hypothetical protein